MQKIISAKLKLTPTEEQFQALRESQLVVGVDIGIRYLAVSSTLRWSPDASLRLLA